MRNAVVTEITSRGAPFISLPSIDLGPLRYGQAEYALSGVASAYVRTGEGVSVVNEADYTTRVLVYRPTDRATFNGTVWVEWLNVSAGYNVPADWIFAHTELMRAGSAWAGVSAQALGVCGGEGIAGLSSPGLVGTDPERYGALAHPGDRYSYDIFSQAGEAVRGRAGTILGDVAVERMVAIGHSQSAQRLTTYANDVDPAVRVFDGFFVHGRMGFGGHFDEWLRAGIRPPHSARLEVLNGRFVTDEHGNVRGGIRTPHVDVPTAVLSGLGNGGSGLADLTGITTPFDTAQLAALYPSRADYLGRFDAATDAAVAAGFVLAADADEIKAVAAENSPI